MIAKAFCYTRGGGGQGGGGPGEKGAGGVREAGEEGRSGKGEITQHCAIFRNRKKQEAGANKYRVGLKSTGSGGFKPPSPPQEATLKSNVK